MQYVLKFYQLMGRNNTATVFATMTFDKKEMAMAVLKEIENIGIKEFTKKYCIYHETQTWVESYFNGLNKERETKRMYPELYKLEMIATKKNVIYDSYRDIPIGGKS